MIYTKMEGPVLGLAVLMFVTALQANVVQPLWVEFGRNCL